MITHKTLCDSLRYVFYHGHMDDGLGFRLARCSYTIGKLEAIYANSGLQVPTEDYRLCLSILYWIEADTVAICNATEINYNLIRQT